MKKFYFWTNHLIPNWEGPFDTELETKQDAKSRSMYKEVSIGEGTLYKASDYYITNAVLDHIDEVVYEYTEEGFDYSEPAKQDLEKQLNSVLQSWFDQHGISPKVYDIVILYKEKV